MWKWWQILLCILGVLYAINIILQILYNDAPSHKVRKIKYMMENFDNYATNQEPKEKDPEYQIDIFSKFDYLTAGLFNMTNTVFSIIDIYVKNINDRIYNEFVYNRAL
jgi:hypothetical protein